METPMLSSQDHADLYPNRYVVVYGCSWGSNTTPWLIYKGGTYFGSFNDHHSAIIEAQRLAKADPYAQVR